MDWPLKVDNDKSLIVTKFKGFFSYSIFRNDLEKNSISSVNITFGSRYKHILHKFLGLVQRYGIFWFDLHIEVSNLQKMSKNHRIINVV